MEHRSPTGEPSRVAEQTERLRRHAVGVDSQTSTVPYTRETVPVDGGELTVGVWGRSGPLVVAVHGITASHMSWALIGRQLGVDHRVVAVDLRGRGGSRDLPGPYGMARHAADLAAVIEAYGGAPAAGASAGPPVAVGHSMGGFVVVELAHRYPDLVGRLVLVDGGAPLPVPSGVDVAAGEEAIEEAIAQTVGTAFARLGMTFPDRESYRAMWKAHPSFVDWTDVMVEYIDYDLVGEEPELHAACRREAAVRDARDVYAFDHVTPRPVPVPAVLLRAARGMFDESEPLCPAGYAARWLPGLAEVTVPEANHYTITLGVAGAAAVVAAVRG